jgi:hypothetical protein
MPQAWQGWESPPRCGGPLAPDCLDCRVHPGYEGIKIPPKRAVRLASVSFGRRKVTPRGMPILKRSLRPPAVDQKLKVSEPVMVAE